MCSRPRAWRANWAGADPLILGGDLNLRPRQHPGFFEALEERYGLAAAHRPALARPPARAAGSSW